MNAPRNILVVKPSSLGDIVHTLPAVAACHRTWPDAAITWLLNPEWAPLLAENPHVAEVLPFPRGEFRGLGALPKIAAWAAPWRRRQFDLVLDFQGLLRSALLARLPRSPRLLGLADAREGARLFYHATSPVLPGEHSVTRYLRLAHTAGADISAPPEFPLPLGTAPVGFDPAEPYLLLHPFARGAGKSWTPAQVTEFCAALAPHRVLLAGRVDDSGTPSAPSAPNVLNFLNRTTLPELIHLLRHAAAVVSVDSGPMHLASALNSRLISMHTWSDPRSVGPFNPEAWIWQHGQLRRVRDLANEHSAQAIPDLPALAQFIHQTLLPTQAP